MNFTPYQIEILKRLDAFGQLKLVDEKIQKAFEDWKRGAK